MGMEMDELKKMLGGLGGENVAKTRPTMSSTRTRKFKAEHENRTRSSKARHQERPIRVEARI